MTPIKITFQSNETIIVYSEDPDGFAASIQNANTPEIKQMECSDIETAEIELQEVQLVLESGTCILCYIEKQAMARADFITGIAECNISLAMTYAKLAKQEGELDERFESVKAIINNIPDLETRKGLHTEYLKRKTAYVSAIEALVDGVIRRPKG